MGGGSLKGGAPMQKKYSGAIFFFERGEREREKKKKAPSCACLRESAFVQWVLNPSIHILNKVRYEWDVI